MTRDWVLTLLTMSPLFVAGAIVILALFRKPAQNERALLTAKTSSPPRRADQMKELSPTPVDVVAR
jgi:hypothetical protein